MSPKRARVEEHARPADRPATGACAAIACTGHATGRASERLLPCRWPRRIRVRPASPARHARQTCAAAAQNAVRTSRRAPGGAARISAPTRRPSSCDADAERERRTERSSRLARWRNDASEPLSRPSDVTADDHPTAAAPGRRGQRPRTQFDAKARQIPRQTVARTDRVPCETTTAARQLLNEQEAMANEPPSTDPTNALQAWDEAIPQERLRLQTGRQRWRRPLP